MSCIGIIASLKLLERSEGLGVGRKKKILIVTANRRKTILKGLLADTGTEIVGVLTYEPWDYPEWSIQSTGLETWGWNQISTSRMPSASVDLQQYETALRTVMHDERVVYLFERHFGIGWNQSAFNEAVTIELVVWNALVILSSQQPDVVFFTSAPHNPISWIFGRVAEVWGGTTLMLNDSPFFHRKWVVRGLDEQAPVEVSPTFASRASEKAWEIVRKNRMTYALGIPSYSREALKSAWRWDREIKYLVRTRPQNIVTKYKQAINKWALYKRYRELSSPVRFDKPYVVFFLHYQPEGTTLPYGLDFSQQWIAISRLRMAMSDATTLVVKEHPGMFLRGMLRPGVRNRQFYDAIASLPNTVLADINQDSFDLVDHSSCVVTITGTAGFQAVARSKPVMVFGAAPYRHFPGVFKVTGVEDIQKAIGRLDASGCKVDDAMIERYGIWVEGISFGVEGMTEDDWFGTAYYERCLEQAFLQLSETKWSYRDAIFQTDWPVLAEANALKSKDACEVP